MAVEQKWVSSRDPEQTLFTSKKEADELDKHLELVENVGLVMEKQVEGLTEKQVEAIGMVLADNKDIFAKALKGKPEILATELLGYDMD